MRPILTFGWLLIPLFVAAYHYGPGQQQLVVDDAAALLRSADQAAQAGQWAGAVERYNAALALLPAEHMQVVRHARVERAKAQMFCRQLPQAHDEMISLVEEMEADPDSDPKLLAEARSVLANSQYYMTWLMRLEGLPRNVWEPEIEAARQTYRLLAERADASADPDLAKRRQEDLESAIRLARMDLSDLQALPLPSQ